LLLLTLAAFRARRLAPLQTGGPRQRFAILIPAHNEELLLPDLLSSLAAQQYPANLWQVHVVVDNCTDRTALVAQAGGAEPHIRSDPANPGKGPALQWLFEGVCPPGVALDAVVILDADSVVSPNFLQVMSEHLERGEKVIQAYYAVRDPALSWNSGLRQAALSVLHFLRPQGRMTLGASVGLKGNGMVFAIDTLRNYDWSTSVTEDIELHMRLILNGERVTFAPDAQVLGEMPNTLQNSGSQHLRWESGKLEMARQYVPRLLRKSLGAAGRGQFRNAYLLLDAVFEYWIPPFSTLFGISGLLALVNLALMVFPI
jgi:cellulose synthase/poly-beta-1,6-N-acetylglucosamine synthase-like glycosyltransferase